MGATSTWWSSAVVEAVVHGDDLFRVWVHAVDGEVEVPVVGIAVEGVDDLVLGETHLVQERGDGCLGLRCRRLFALVPSFRLRMAGV